jgi:EAL domain-containing protein (putative c-di-GMP-specific phosphodiesterase class I)
MFSVEITESIIGSDLEFMKGQIERFQALGFPVWMDDFGSGYSSLDFLQSIHFDLLKFDMGFMRKLDESANGKIILTELMRMAAALGVETICEGVETEGQVRFLRRIGCTKLQGYYYSKPITLEEIMQRSQQGTYLSYEDHAESV